MKSSTLTVRIAFLTALFFSTPSLFALESADDLYEKLTTTDRDYHVFGTVCEEAARVQLEETYPGPLYYATTSISYRNNQKTLGELDVVVFDNNSEEAVLVAEVKCWSHLSSARAKAESQIKRFSTIAAEQTANITMKSENSKAKHASYRLSQFDSVAEYATIAQKGSVESGFDYELALTLDEFAKLRERLIACFDSGECPKSK